jgi:hypothetical protein
MTTLPARRSSFIVTAGRNASLDRKKQAIQCVIIPDKAPPFADDGNPHVIPETPQALSGIVQNAAVTL